MELWNTGKANGPILIDTRLVGNFRNESDMGPFNSVSICFEWKNARTILQTDFPIISHSSNRR